MKSSELLRKLQADGWYDISQNGSHIKLAHATKKAPTTSGYIIFPSHGSDEVGKGLAAKIKKQAGLK
ncbi:type II toxin-antitoxin system HicA family toxin [Hymenobacter sp. AT01-02]|uniref:type II toxin-antitoxin system HicA family toxin n=1 Tax=Hymenobacter sp. AT01-02 TaxID=1571877 RepID=UPI0005F194C2|nr:type II toxin-antitoxin system HicA family toxin [Hymenobacter sp. AT01-02]